MLCAAAIRNPRARKLFARARGGGGRWWWRTGGLADWRALLDHRDDARLMAAGGWIEGRKSE